jgi:uncharacterized membrane protein YfcA
MIERMIDLPLSVFLSMVASIALAYLVLGLTGFGSALVAVPLLLLFMPLGQAVPLVLFLDVVALIVFGALNLAHVDWQIWRRMLPSVAVGIVSATLIVKLGLLPGSWLLLLLGLYIVWFGASKLRLELKAAKGTPLASAKPAAQAGAGFWQVAPYGWLAGMIEAWFGTCGPIIATGILKQSSNMQLFKATMSAIMLPAALMALLTYLVAHSASAAQTNSEVIRAVMLAPVAVAAVWIGNRFAKNVPQPTIRRAVFTLLCISGCVLMFKAVRSF